MQFAETDIIQLAADIWSSVLGATLEPAAAPTMPPAVDRLTGCVQIAGAWQGSVTLDASRQFASGAAATMFNKSANEISDEDVVDALAELTNMLGGNIKSVLPGPSFLALPSVTEGIDYDVNLPGTRRLSEVALDCNGQPLCIQLFEQDKDDDRR